MATIEIKIEIDSNNIDDLKIGFIRAAPKPPQYYHLSDLEYFKKWIEDSIIHAYKTGKILIAQETTQPNIIDNIVTVS